MISENKLHTAIRNCLENTHFLTTIPEGMKKNERFNVPILTPTTKLDTHDESTAIEARIKHNVKKAGIHE